jgi:threonine synthase
MDADLNDKFSLTSANSINIARWLPQQLYYFFAYQQWQHDEPPIICVPSGNFGNICAGVVAWMSGLPVKHFIAACNANDVVPLFLQTGTYKAKQAVATISNAMDVGNPSNFVRIMELFAQKTENLKSMFSSISVSDATTKSTIKEVHEKYNYLLDPHGAVAYQALENYLQHSSPGSAGGFFLETAHPVKFPGTVEEVTGQQIPFPESVQYLSRQKKLSVLMDARFDSFKDWMMSRS